MFGRNQFFTEFSILGESQNFTLLELLLIKGITDSKAEAKRLVKQGFTVWTDLTKDVSADTDSTLFDRCQKLKSNEIELSGGDSLVFGKSKDGQRINVWSKDVQNKNDWNEKIIAKKSEKKLKTA